jgi:beta-glucosidase
MAKIYASRSNEVSKREIDHMNRIRKLTSQGMVLLENDGVLPLSDKSSKIALYGSGVRKTIKGGTGSGDVNSRTWVNVEQGFENAGFEVTSKGWLDAFDAQMANANNEHFAKIREMSEKSGEPVFQVFFKNPFVAPEAKTLPTPTSRLPARIRPSMS